MRSNKELGLRLAAACAWIAVLAGAAYASVNLRGKNWRDYPPIEKIGYFTPDHVEWAVALDGGTQVADVSGTTGSFVIVFPMVSQRSVVLLSVCGESFGEEIEPGSAMEHAI